ncbi:MAG: DUF302 domain-containing protein [Bryobacterales bacterium]|nr:DUF302 domain-containing protein [Bryobacteraceae bacterium]MDW8131707.1 DUF302 domain-containing protein [Bryobacterales bacterium]
MLFEVETRKSLEEIDRGLSEAAARHGFGILTVHNIRETMRKKGVDYSGDCLIYEVCNPHQARRVLEANPAISTALPCRISVYRSGDACKLATILPTATLALFGTPGLEEVARDVEQHLCAMMREAAE